MPTEKQKERADSVDRYILFATIAFGFVAFITELITKQKMLGVRMFATALWLGFAAGNFTTFYTGRMRWKNGPTFTREISPIRFYASAVFFCVSTMSITTFLLWKAYTSK
jgi:hypothetical protein